MKVATAIRHVHFEDAGAFAPVLAAHGYQLRYCDAGADELDPAALAESDLLIVLGGPIGAYEDDKYPFLARELAVLESRLSLDRPVLGICLGAQLMARTLGARVYPAPAKEIGWAPVDLTPAGRAGPARHLAGGPVLHWHGDTFDLPRGADLLASTDLCLNQAFACGNTALALQFHPEASAEGFERWLIGHAVEIAATPGVSVAGLRADTLRFAPDAARRGQQCLSEWLRGLDPA